MIVACLLLATGSMAQQRKSPVSGTIRAGGFRVFYAEQGSGDPVLLLHAGLQDHRMWAAQVAALSKRYRVVTIDLPFHGQTEGMDTSILAKEVIRTVLDSLRIEKVTIGGLSMGAAVTQDFVIGYPGRVKKAMFLAAGINGYERDHPIDSVSMAWFPKFMAALERKDTGRAALEFALAWGEGQDARGNKLQKPASRGVYETTFQTLKKHKMAGWPNLQDEPVAYDQIRSISVPVLLLHGDRDLPLVLAANDYMEKNIRSARRIVLKGAAHMVNVERPEEVTKALEEFLR